MNSQTTIKLVPASAPRCPMDQAVFEEHYARHKDSVLSYAAFCLNGRTKLTTPEDIAQEVFLTFWTDYPQGESPPPIRPWLLRVTRFRCNDVLKECHPEWFTEAQLSKRHDSEPGPYAAARGKDCGEALRRLVEELPEKRRDVFLLRQMGMSLKEIAEVLECGERTARRHMAEAHAWLEGQLEKIGVFDDDR